MTLSHTKPKKSLAEAPLKSEWAFHQAINNIFIDLHDPHTVYVKPSLCYNFFMVLGLTLNSTIDPVTQNQIIVVKGASDPSLKQYVGMVVRSIDGVDGLTALTNFGFSQMFVSKDPSTAFNSAIQNGYVQRYGGIYDFPQNINTTWVLSKLGSSTNVTVTLSWQAIPQDNMNIIPSACTASAAFAHEQQKTKKRKARGSARIPEWRRAPLSRDILFGPKAAQRPDISFVNISSSTMLLTITTFEPNDETAFLQTLTNGIAFATQNNITQLIIDTSGNGGGDICLGYTVISQLLNEVCARVFFPLSFPFFGCFFVVVVVACCCCCCCYCCSLLKT